jgi:hypothetical protein
LRQYWLTVAQLVERRPKVLAADNDVAQVAKQIVLNMPIGGTDDHARNHAAFWDSSQLDFTASITFTLSLGLEPKPPSDGLRPVRSEVQPMCEIRG